jgi:hypothetical protein
MARETATLKKLREEAEKALGAGVSNKAQLVGAVPALVALQRRIGSLRESIKASSDVAAALSRLCSDYAHEHPAHVFDQTFSVSPIGVESGDLAIDGRTYHFSYGFDGYVRTEPEEKLTREFLDGLPKGWTREKPELDVSAINRAKPSDGELEEHGLMHKVKCTWSELD